MHPETRPIDAPPPVVAATAGRTLLDEIILENRVAGARYMPVMTAKDAKARMVAIQELKELCLVEGEDYGAIPGTGTKEKPAKPTLLKPGAEKICAYFGYVPRYTILAGSIEDWTGERFGEALFYYHVSCTLYRGESPVGEGSGSCSTWERKYRYRTSKRSCPACGEQQLIKGKLEWERDPAYQDRGAWICYEKRGGCGAKYFGDDAEIMGQPLGDVPNPDVADIVNTVRKMADKRAYIASTLSATGASQWFTQDTGDDDGVPPPAPYDAPPQPTANRRDPQPPPPPPAPLPLSRTKEEAQAYTRQAKADKAAREAAAEATSVWRIDEERAKLAAMPASFEVQMVRAFDACTNGYERLAYFHQLKTKVFPEVFGAERAEPLYYEFLTAHDVKKSSEFKKLRPARECFVAMLTAAKREMDRQQVHERHTAPPTGRAEQ